MAADLDRELAEQVLAAEQDERRRIALFLHDGPVQSLAGVALMLDASLDLIARGEQEQAREILDRALSRTRATVGELRDLSFNLEPVALRDHGFATAVDALLQSRCQEHRIEVSLDVEAVDALGEQTQAALYQIVREALEEAIRRGPPSRFDVAAETPVAGTLRLVIRDDAPTERRRRALEVLGERARTLGATLSLEHDLAGTTMTLDLRRLLGAKSCALRPEATQLRDGESAVSPSLRAGSTLGRRASDRVFRRERRRNATLRSRPGRRLVRNARLEFRHSASGCAAPARYGAAVQHLLFVWKPSGYELVEQEGDPPSVGAEVEFEGKQLRVTKLAPSPLPGDRRVCAYLGG